MLVGWTAAEILRVRRTGVAVARLHEHQRDRRTIGGRGEQVERSVESIRATTRCRLPVTGHALDRSSTVKSRLI
jgi:hypothetical protein